MVRGNKPDVFHHIALDECGRPEDSAYLDDKSFSEKEIGRNSGGIPASCRGIKIIGGDYQLFNIL